MKNTPALPITGIDHMVLMTEDIEKTLAFYKQVLGAHALFEEAFREDKIQTLPLKIGGAVINLQAVENPAYIAADKLVAGSADLCLRWTAPIDAAIAHLAAHGVDVIEGPVDRPAADGAWGKSVYFRDPDGNLLELLSTVGE